MTEPLLVKAVFTDYDHFTKVAKGFDVETVLYGTGGFRAEFLQWIDPITVRNFWRLKITSPVRQWGAIPHGRAFIVPSRRSFRMHWRDQLVTGDDIAVFPLNGELMADVRNPFDAFGVAIPEETILRLADDFELSHLGSMLRSNEVFRCLPDDLATLRNHLRAAERFATTTPAAVRNLMDDEILETLVRTLARSTSAPPGKVQPRRDKAVKLAADYVRQHAQDAPSVRELCRITKTSDRTLELGFKERLGITPKAFITASRLHGVRKELMFGDSEIETVAGIAFDWNFKHLGQFASDYRRVFHEFPSETLGRSPDQRFVAR